MSALFQIESSDQRDQPESLQSLRLAQELKQYQQLRGQEKKLRGRVEYLEKQAARHGQLNVPVDVALLLQEEREKLTALRQELALQEEQLASLAALPAEQRSTIEAEQLEQLLSDLKIKREQARLIQGNLNFLEEKEAQFGVNTRVDLANELRLTQEELERVRLELSQLEKKLKALWQLDPGAIPDFDLLDDAQIKKLAREIISQRETTEREQARKNKAAFVEKYETVVTTALNELRESLNAGSSYRVSSQFGATGEAVWKLSTVGSFDGIEVELAFDCRSNPLHFQCTRFNHDHQVVSQLQAELTRASLVETLKALHQKKNPWWKFW